MGLVDSVGIAYSVPMSTTQSVSPDEAEQAHPGIPLDSFRVRIAAIRAERGWNVSQAAMACGLSVENWRKWEKNGRRPQAYEETCRRIADGSGYDRAWIASGGPLRSRCVNAVPDAFGQMHLPYTEGIPVVLRVAV